MFDSSELINITRTSGVVLRPLISTPENKQRIGPDQRFLRSVPIQQAISSKRTSGVVGSQKEKLEIVPVSHPPFCKFYQVLFNYFNLCEIIQHFDWSPCSIRGTGPKKVENISNFYYPASNVAGSIGTKNFC
jgi:hypothetical protein